MGNGKLPLVRLYRDPDADQADTRPWRGEAYLPEWTGSCFLLARTESGKSTVLENLIRHGIDRRTKVHLFVGTLDVDPVWQRVLGWLRKRGIDHEAHTSIFGDVGHGRSRGTLLDALRGEAEAEAETAARQPGGGLPQLPPAFASIAAYYGLAGSGAPKPRNEDNSGCRVPANLYVLDDLGEELKHPSVGAFLKQVRHRGMALISSQYVKDLRPAALRQLKYAILFRGLDEPNVDLVHGVLCTSLTRDEFRHRYARATDPDTTGPRGSKGRNERPFLVASRLPGRPDRPQLRCCFHVWL